MTDSQTPAAVPEWTARHVRGGLDPLGMQAGSIALYQTLLPGLSNVTNRMRYYGLYVWLAEHYARHDRRASRKAWQRMLRRAEARSGGVFLVSLSGRGRCPMHVTTCTQ